MWCIPYVWIKSFGILYNRRKYKNTFIFIFRFLWSDPCYIFMPYNTINWSKKWQMIFNPSKCYTLRITKGKQSVIYPYHMEGQVLESVNNPYLGVELSSTLSWDTHIGNILTKVNKSLGFIQRNLGRCLSHKYQATSLPQPCNTAPHLEYASSVWDPHLQKHIYQIEMVQRRATQFIKHKY
jgi:hypothetical protein